MSPNCGRLWSESQLEYQQIGRKKIPVCPHCRLGVSKLQKKLNFWTSAPRAFLYPFQGVGGWVVGFGAPLFALLNHVGFGVLLLFPKLAIFGFFGMMLLNVIRTTADDEEESLDWPALEGKFEFVVVGLQIIGGTLIVFGPALLCAMQAGISFLGRGGSPATPGIWAMAMLACLALGVVYYPMGLVGIAMFDSIKGLNPLLIVPAIFKVPLQYLLVLVLLAALWLTRIPAAMVANLFHFPWSLIPIIIADGIVLYTLIVSARLLGLLYRANAERIGWFT